MPVDGSIQCSTCERQKVREELHFSEWEHVHICLEVFTFAFDISPLGVQEAEMRDQSIPCFHGECVPLGINIHKEGRNQEEREVPKWLFPGASPSGCCFGVFRKKAPEYPRRQLSAGE